MGGSGPEDKPFRIPKQLVWEAYRSVKRNKGAAGVDGQSIEDFEKDRDANLYKIWNRMSSGSYFPPAVSIKRAFVGPRDPEVAGDLGVHRYLRIAQFGVESLAEGDSSRDPERSGDQLHK